MKAILAAVSLFAASAQAGTVLWSGIFNSSFTTATFDKCESGLFEPLSLFTFIFFTPVPRLLLFAFGPRGLDRFALTIIWKSILLVLSFRVLVESDRALAMVYPWEPVDRQVP